MAKNPFKIGDKVRVKDTHDNRLNCHANDKIGKVFTIHDILDDLIYIEPKDGTKFGGLFYYRFEKVEDAKGEYILILKNEAGKLLPSPTPRVYTTEAQAKAVAASMAEKNPGLDFLIFKAVGKARTEKPKSVVEMF